MKISKFQFYLITILFLLLPFSVQWRLLLFGIKTTGTVIGYDKGSALRSNLSESPGKYSIIRFEAAGRYYDFAAPEHIVYPIGKKITILYNRKKPKQFLMLNFTGLVLSNKMIIPFVAMILWFAFYLSVNQPQLKKRQKS